MIGNLGKRIKTFWSKIISVLNNEPNLSVIPLAAFIGGVIGYFAVSFEPNVWIVSCVVILLCGLCLIKCHRVVKILGIVTPLFLCVGILVPCIHARLNDTRFIAHALVNVDIEGVITDVRIWPNRTIVDVVPRALYRKTKAGIPVPILTTEELPSKIRLTIQFGKGNVRRGDMISGTISRLVQPPPRTTPHSLSQAASFWFDGIGAVGTIIRPTIKPQNKPQSTERLIHLFDPLREHIHTVFQRVFSSENAGVAEALVVGNTDFVSDSSRRLYRTLGLSHILAVSGYHISLIAFMIFWFVRLLLNILPINLSTSAVKRIAATVSLGMACFYTLLSGAQAPVVRAFIMVIFVLAAVFFDKRPFSLRSIFIAALIMLCFMPQMILSVSFQLSFMAVLCLIGICTVFQNKMRHRISNGLMKFLGIFTAFVMFNVLVTIATLPYVAFYFNQVQTYTLVGNILLSSIFGVLIVPVLFVGVLLMNTPIGLGLFVVIDKLLTVVYHIGMPITQWPNTVIVVPHFYPYGLVLWTFGMFGITIFKSKIRYLFLGLMCLILTAFWGIEKPTGIIGAGGNYIGARNDENVWVTESFYYPRWHTPFMLYNRLLPEDNVPLFLYREWVDFGVLTIGQTVAGCEQNTFNIYRKKMDVCPRLVTVEQMLDLHSVLIYVDKTPNGFFARLWIAGNTDKNRPWHGNGGTLPITDNRIRIME